MSSSHDVVIVGTGFSGLCAAIRLKQAGRHDLVLLERGDAIGGTWRDNVYPGCACDVPSHLYSFSFAPNPDWTRAFAPQAEIRAYLERCTDAFGVRPHVRLREEVRRATWDDARRRWTVETSAGGRYEARVLIWGTGGLSHPAYPDLPGLERFEGPAFHSATWRHDVDLTGKRVAVIGTGASAIQFVPQIVPRVARLSLFQRTPPWILPRPDRAIPAARRRLFARVPLAQRLARWSLYAQYEARVLGLTVSPRLAELGARVARGHLTRQVPDPALRAKLTPDYVLGCKRVLLSNDYYPALRRPNVEVITDPIAEVLPAGIRTASGREVEADVLIHGTGFAVHDLVKSGQIAGVGGRDLAETWRRCSEAYKGTTVAGFPNLFVLTGPNTGLGHNSMVFMIESQVTYVLDALRQMEARGWEAVEVTREAQGAWNEAVQARTRGTVWASGCRSWYLDANGRNVTLWPDFTFRFWRHLSRFDAERYRVVPAG